MKPLTVEVVLFKLKPTTDEAAFLKAADAIMPDLRSMPGYLRRELLKGDDGQWLDVVYWRSLAEAQQAAQDLMQRPAVQPLFGMLDETTVTILHPHQARVYGE
jgi:GH15 family glucan-1,4-alpha-glucosidase